MPGHKITLWVQALLLLFNFGYPIYAQSGEAKTGTATVSGRVTMKGEPARGVTVLLKGQQSDAISSPRARTDEEGRFWFMGVASGMYSISALTPGYLSPGVDGMINRGQAINVAEGEKVENISLEIKRGGVIAGRITDSQGAPVIEESIYLHKLDKDDKPNNIFIPAVSSEVFRTDDRGVYRIFGLPEGRYLVSVGHDRKPGSISVTLSDRFYPRVFYQNSTSEAAAKVIEITEGSEATDIDITLPDQKKAYKIYGRAVNAGDRQPVPGVEFIVGSLSEDGKLTGGPDGIGERSKPDGGFHFMVSSPGRYMLFVRADSPGDREIIAEPVIFDVGEGDPTVVEVKVRQAGSISGVVVIEGTSDPKILSKLTQIKISSFYRSIKSTIPRMPIYSGIPDVKVNAGGDFRIGGLQPGNVFIAVKPAPDIRGLTVARIVRDRAAASSGIFHDRAAARDSGIDMGAGE